MAAPLAKFKMHMFNSPIDLQKYVTDAASDVASIVAIVFDDNGKYILFYMTP